MSKSTPLVGNRVRVTGYGPLRGLQGTIQRVDMIADDPEDPFCFYLIALAGATTQAPIWFECHDVEFIGFPASIYHKPGQLASVGPR